MKWPLIALCTGVLLLAGCGGDDDSADAGSTRPTAAPDTSVGGGDVGGGGSSDDEAWDRVEEVLISADLGADLAVDVIERARKRRDLPPELALGRANGSQVNC